jgi:hypothetical protein
MTTFLLHLTHPSGTVQTVPCATRFLRALWIISLAGQPVVVRIEDRVSA